MSQAGEINVVQNHPEIPTMFITDAGTAVPIANTLEILGIDGITTLGSGNTVTIEGTAFALTVTGNSGGPIVPVAQNWNLLGTGSITSVGTPGTITHQLTGLTNHNVLVGAGTATITKVPPSATAGIPLVSNGAASDPSFSTALIAGGGTASTSFNVDGVVVSGTTGTSALTAVTLTNGQLAIGSTGAVPVAGAITSTGGTITVTLGAGTINIDLAGGGMDIDSIAVQAATAPGTNPVLPTVAGLVTINGAAVAAQTIPIQSNSLAANTLQIEVQRASSSAATNATQQGLASFNSAQFTVDASGWVSAGGTGILSTLTGNSGGAISPTAGNINTLGTGSITIAGAGSTLTTQLTGLTNHAIQIGAGTATLTQLAATATTGQILQNNAAADPSYSTATYPSTTTVSQILYSSATNVVSGLATANRGVLTTGATGIPVITALATDGQLIIGSTSGVPAASTLTAGTGITITNGSNSITIAVSGSAVGETITGDSGGALSPTAGNWNLLGSGSITTSGSGSTLTTQLTGLTNHAVLVGAGTTTITLIAATANTGAVLQNNSSADPSYSTATYPSTSTINQILYSSAANTITGLASANQGVLTTGTTGIPVITAMATNGALIIGSTAGAPASATLTAGVGISITNGSNSITIAASGAGFSWNDVTSATQTLAVANGYVTDRAGGVVYTLPATANLGDEIKIVGKSGIAVITPLINQQILIGSNSGTVGITGTATANDAGDCLELVCITGGASTVWRSAATMGTWTLA